MPSLPAMISPTPSPFKTPQASPTLTPPPTVAAQKSPAAAIAIDEISDSQNYPGAVRKIVDLGLELTGRNLGYKYVSADPRNGGMDSSGFIYYVLTQSGMRDVPRDAREQYIWSVRPEIFRPSSRNATTRSSSMRSSPAICFFGPQTLE